VLLICGYFREKVTGLQHANRDLIYSVRCQQHTVEEKTRLLNRWSELSHQLITSSNLDHLLELTVATAIEVTDGDTASLMLLDEETQELRIAAAQGLDPKVVEKTRVRLGEGIAGVVAEQGRPLLLPPDSADARLSGLLTREAEVHSAACVPLMLGGRTIGTLNVNRTSHPQHFTRADVETLQMFASQAVLAIEKTQLYREAQEQVERLRQMLEELEHTQAQLLQSEKLASVGLLAGGVAHEINNPLMVILGRTELLLEESPEDPVGRDLRLIREQTVRIAEIVKNLLRFSRTSGDSAKGRVTLNRAIEDTLGLVSHIMKVENILVETNLAADLPPVLGNAGQLQQIFTNLIINAFHAMPKGGRLIVRTWAAQGRVLASVTDTGFGIPEEHLAHIFDPFFTTKPAGVGTGLGLSICHGIVASLGGEITVDSLVGLGTTFRVHLPADAKIEPAAAPLPPRRPRVLVIEPEPAVASVLQRALSDENDVVIAASGDAALACLSGSERIDAIVCDLTVEGPNAAELHARVAALRPGLERSLVFTSGGAPTPEAQALLETVANPCLEKPFDIDDRRVVRARVRGA
jgi:signal transduction histidine kinase